MRLASAYPNSALPASALLAIALVAAGTLAVWLALVFIAARRQTPGTAPGARPAGEDRPGRGQARQRTKLPDGYHAGSGREQAA
jgi:hypothetical protein